MVQSLLARSAGRLVFVSILLLVLRESQRTAFGSHSDQGTITAVIELRVES